jgi:hypothetical protein
MGVMIGRAAAQTAEFRRTVTSGWLGCQDSNLGMAESKSAALPLGYTPKDKTAFGAVSMP